MRLDGILDRVDVGTMRRWPVTHKMPVLLEQADLTMRYLHRTLAGSGVLASPGLILRGTPGHGIEAWITACSLDGSDPDAVLRLSRAVAPWLGIGAPVDGGFAPLGGTAIGFTARAATNAHVIAPEASVFARYLAGSPHPWQLTVQVGFAAPTDGDDEVELGLSLVGHGDDVSVAAPLLSGDALVRDGAVRLVPRYAEATEAAGIIAAAAAGRAPSVGFVPEAIAGKLMSLPARVSGSWHEVPVPPEPPAAVIEAARTAVPPHVLVQGGSGQGKTTLLEHLVDASLDEGAAIVVVCPHGDLARRAAARIVRRGMTARMVDYGADQPVPWNLTVPDPGIGFEEHASLLTDVIRQLWLDADGDWFGPVWTRVMRALVSILVRDPAGPHSIVRLPELLSPESRLRYRAVQRIADPALERLVESELLPMLRAKDPGNTVVWLVSKLDHLIGDPTMRAIVGGRLHALDVAGALRGESFIAAVPERHLTPDGARTLASMVIGRLWLLLRRNEASRPVHLYVDEWQKLPIPAFGQILAEGRKRNLHLRLANQNSSQIPQALWDTTAGNTGAIISFRTGPRDAARIAPMFHSISPDQVTRLPHHWAAVTTGARDLIAPGPEPIEGDDGVAFADGHAATLAGSRRQADGLFAGLLRALIEDRCPPFETDRTREVVGSPGDVDGWLHAQRTGRVAPPAAEPSLWDDPGDDGIDRDALPDPF